MQNTVTYSYAWVELRGLKFEALLELYSLRRASGNNFDSALDAVDRNQAVGYFGSTYERYYTPTHIACDFQAIYFGTPSEEKLIRSIASLGLSFEEVSQNKEELGDIIIGDDEAIISPPGKIRLKIT
ncbi:hypothetical protein GQ44DRAFT_787304 [Phaeosphaeriaceae sp. PMI808]|nr:hypothetical protein GQ44DRAFT_787304 [Phaeosphaeriaceae sp. PMI808]